jgi:hypothetical protein
VNEALEHLRLAANQLFRARRESIPADSPASRALDKAIVDLKALIDYLGGNGAALNPRESLRNIILALEPFKSKYEGVEATLLELLEAQSALNGTFFEVALDGEINRRPRR